MVLFLPEKSTKLPLSGSVNRQKGNHKVDQYGAHHKPLRVPLARVRILKGMTAVVPFHASHLPGVYAVCMETGSPGWKESTPEANPDLLGHVYAGPYAIHSPDLAHCVVDEHGVAGYLLAVADSDDFWGWEDTHWWPPLRAQYPQMPGDSWNPTIIQLIHEPPRTPPDIVSSFPAHLHIDLLPRAQGLGLGRVLIENLQAALRLRGVPGLHLDVSRDNHNAIEFYQYLGFEIAHETPQAYYMTIAL